MDKSKEIQLKDGGKLNYVNIKNNNNLHLPIIVEKGSSDACRLGEILLALGYDKERSSFSWTEMGGIMRVDDGVVVFNNGCVVIVK